MLGLYYTSGPFRQKAPTKPRQPQTSQPRPEPTWAARTNDNDDKTTWQNQSQTSKAASYHESTPSGGDAQFFADYPFNREPLSEDEEAFLASIFQSVASAARGSRNAQQARFLKSAARANDHSSGLDTITSYGHDVWDKHFVSQKKGNTLAVRKVAGTLAAATLITTIVGVLAATYFLVPGAQTWMNAHAITPLAAQHLTIGQGFYMIGLPIAGLMTGLGVGLYVWQKSKRKAEAPVVKGIREPRFSEGQKRAAKVAGVVAVAALLVAGACLAYYFCPQVAQALSHKLTLGQSLAYVGAPTVALGIVANGALTLYLRRQKMKEAS